MIQSSWSKCTLMAEWINETWLVHISCVLSRSVMSDSATPWTVAHQAPLSMGFSRQEYWSGLPLPSPGDLPDRDWTQDSCIAGRFFTIWDNRGALVHILVRCKKKGNSSTCYTAWKNLGHSKWNKMVTWRQMLYNSTSEVPRGAKFIETESQKGIARDWEEG